MSDEMRLFECSYCAHRSAWTDGTSRALGDPRDEFWCPHCGEVTELFPATAAWLNGEDVTNFPALGLYGEGKQ